MKKGRRHGGDTGQDKRGIRRKGRQKTEEKRKRKGRKEEEAGGREGRPEKEKREERSWLKVEGGDIGQEKRGIRGRRRQSCGRKE